MSFLYPRRIIVSRHQQPTGAGAMPYGGHVQADEIVVAPITVAGLLFNVGDLTFNSGKFTFDTSGPISETGIAASIQNRREGFANPVGLPGDGSVPWSYCFIPLKSLSLGAIHALDIVTDDLGRRYQVVDPYWDAMGYRLSMQVLEA